MFLRRKSGHSCIPVSIMYFNDQIEDSPLHAVFFSFTHSVRPSFIHLCVALLRSVQLALMGFIDITFDMCHPSMLALILISLSINQNVNVDSIPSSLLSVPFCLPHFFPLLLLFIHSNHIFSLLALFSLHLFYHHPSPSPEHDLLCASLTVMASGGGR